MVNNDFCNRKQPSLEILLSDCRDFSNQFKDLINNKILKIKEMSLPI